LFLVSRHTTADGLNWNTVIFKL